MPDVTESTHQRRFRDTIFRETGIQIPESKDHLVSSRLRKRLLKEHDRKRSGRASAEAD